MIKGIILDVDGVLLGTKRGYNFPDPHPRVIDALRSIRQKGIIVSLCTGKGTFAIKDLVIAAKLNNLHIGDGGAVVVDFIDNIVIDKHFIPKAIALQVTSTYVSNNFYVELYTMDGYYVQENQVGEITDQHTTILHRAPIIVDSLPGIAKEQELIKIMPITNIPNKKQEITTLFAPFVGKMSLQWGFNPLYPALQFGIMTAPGISKKEAAMKISDHTGVPFEQMLGVGDLIMDWEFIQLCQYAGAMGNATDDLKKFVETKGKGNYFIGKHVDENGLLDIFKFFKLLG